MLLLTVYRKISVLLLVLMQVQESLRLFIIKALQIDLLCRAGNGLAPTFPPLCKALLTFPINSSSVTGAGRDGRFH